MNPFQQHLESLLGDHLKKRRVAVWYDLDGAFAPFIESLELLETMGDGLSKITINGTEALLASFHGSFFGLRHPLEPHIAADQPGPLIVYLPGVARDKEGSVLMELEKGGVCLDWNFRRQARSCLRAKFTDGMIDEMLSSDKITYQDIIDYYQQSAGEKPSVLRTVYKDRKDNAALLASFLADPRYDTEVLEKGADQELFLLMASRTGFIVSPGTALDGARQSALRFVLVNEFRHDLTCPPPACVALIPEVAGEHLELVRHIAETMRDHHAEAYVAIADRVAEELGLAHQSIDPRALGRVDTFRFEETILLSLAGEQIRQGQYQSALQLVTERKSSFWVDRHLMRQSQWEACRLMARLGIRIQEAAKTLKKADDAPAAWVDAYCREGGWHGVDQAQHAMEAWVAKMEEEPENEAAMEMVRQAYEDLIQAMTQGFMISLSAHNWSVSSYLPQNRIYAAVVEQEKTPTAYFLVDAMRFAMAAELILLLSAGRDMMLRPAIGAWPTITPVGMAALLPSADISFSIVGSEGKLAVQVDGTKLLNVAGRMKYLKSRIPGATEMQLEKLLDMSSTKLAKAVAQSPLVVIRSQEIDALGEIAGNLVARQLMDTMVGNVARAVKKLAAVGIHRFVITADHGHLFTRKKEDAFKTDPPGGKTLEIHRRCWIGHGGGNPPGTVRVSGTQVGYDTDLDLVFPRGIGVFKTGGDLGYHHGGLSLQEMIIPVLTLKMEIDKAPSAPDATVQLLGEPGEITNRTFGIRLALIGLFDVQPLAVRPILLSKGVIVGKAGMALDAAYDQEKGEVILEYNKTVSVAMILEMDEADQVRVVVQDPATDRVLAQSKDIKVKLGTR